MPAGSHLPENLGDEGLDVILIELKSEQASRSILQQSIRDAIRQRWSDITLGQIHGCDDLGNCSTVSND
jgi:hypothetical protein